MDELTDDNIARVTDTYHAWRNRTPSPPKGEPHPTPSPLKGEGRGEGIATYADIPGFCKSAPRWGSVQARPCADPRPLCWHGSAGGGRRAVREQFEDKMKRLVAQLRNQQAKARKLDVVIEANLRSLGFGIGREVK